MIKKIFLLFFFPFIVSCQSFESFSFSDPGWIRKQWIVNVLSEPYLKTKIIQKTPTILASNFIIQGDSLYGVRAYDKEYGNLQWFFAVIGGIETGIHHSDKRIFFGGSDGFFYCLETSTGQMLWKFFTGSENISTPFVYGNIAYFATSKGKVYAINVRTGRTLWIYSQSNTTSNLLSVKGVSRPVVDKKRVYIGLNNGSFVVLNKQTGKRIWQIQLSKKTDLFKDSDSHPVIVGNFIYASSFSGGLFCLDKTTGKVIWRSEKGSHSSPTIEGRYLYYASTDNHILALNRFNGKLVWSQPTKSLATQPIVYKSKLIYGLAKGGLVVIQKEDGSVANSLNLFRGISTHPVIDSSSNSIFIMSLESWLYKFKILI